MLDLPARWDELDDPTPAAARAGRRASADGRHARCTRAPAARGAGARARADQFDLATAEACARRLTPLHTVAAGASTDTSGEIAAHRPRGPARPRRRAGLRPRRGLAAPARPRPAAGAHRARRGRRAGPPRHQGVRPAGHGPARPGDRRHRLGQVGVPAHPRARARADPLARAAQHRAGRLQGRRDLRRDGADAARLGGDHQPGRGADPGRPHAGRPVRRDGPPPGAAPRGRQLRLRPRLREGPGGRRGPRPAAVAVHRGRRVLRAAVGQAGVHRPVRRHRPAGPVAGHAPAARLASAWRRAGCAAWSPTCPTGSGCAPSPPPSPAPCSASRTRTSCPPVPGLGYLKPDPSTLVRFKAAYVSGPPPSRARVRRDEGGHVRGILPFTISEVQTLERGRARAGARAGAAEQGEQASCWTSRSPTWSARARRPTGCGCRRWTTPTPSTSCCRDLAADPGSVWSRRSGAGSAGSRTPRHRGPAARAAPRHPRGRPGRRRRARGGGRRTPQGQEHAAAHRRRQPVADHTPREVSSTCSTSAAARSRRSPTCRTSPGSPPAPSRTWCAASSPRSRASSTPARRTSAPRASTRSRPTARAGRPGAPTTATATCSWSSTAGARCAPTSTTSRSSCSSWPPAA